MFGGVGFTPWIGLKGTESAWVDEKGQSPGYLGKTETPSVGKCLYLSRPNNAITYNTWMCNGWSDDWVCESRPSGKFH